MYSTILADSDITISTYIEDCIPCVGEIEGLAIYIQDERNAKHKRPHFHASTPGWAASIALDNLEVIKGNLPRNKRKAVLEYGRRHNAELRDNYNRILNHQAHYWIEV